jgi:hypothetical protein
VGVSKRTLARWVGRGLLESPVTTRHPSGRGRVGTWPAHVTGIARRIKELFDQGQTLDAIKTTLAREAVERWTGAANAVAVEVDGKSWSRNDVFLGFVFRLLSAFGFDGLWPELSKAWSADGLLAKVLKARAEGHPLLLVYDGRRVETIRATSLSQRFAAPKYPHQRQPALIIPLEFPLWETYAAFGEELPQVEFAWPVSQFDRLGRRVTYSSSAILSDGDEEMNAVSISPIKRSRRSSQKGKGKRRK